MAPKKKEKKKTEKAVVKNEEQKKDSKFNKCKIIASVVVIILAALTYHIYVSVWMVPAMPKFDLDIWWGPNNTRIQDTSIRPYRILLTDSMQENLRRKFEAYRRVTRVKSFNETSEYGINSDVLGQIFAHWQFQYNYRHQTRYMNKFNHYKTNIQGLDIHFMRVKPENAGNVKVLPLLLIHGWPSSVRDFYEIIPLLTTVRPEHDFVFEIIAPSLPGFAYSQGAVKPGLTTYQAAIILRNLMEKLGYKQFYIHGGSLGHIIGSHIATIFPKQVLGFHSSTPINYSKLAQLGWIIGALCQKCGPDDIVDKMYPLKDKLLYYLEESGFIHLQSTKPDTLGIVLQDSPLGLAAFITEKYLLYTEPNNKYIQDGGLSSFNKTDLLDNVLMYWSTGSITTSLRLFKESVRYYEVEETLARIPTPVPTWGLRTKYDLFQQPDSILKWKYPNLVGTTNLDIGGHFMVFEKPNKVANDIFKAVGSFLHRRN